MSHISRSLPFNKLGHLVALAAMLVALLIAGAGTAQANWYTTTEGFEKAGTGNFGFAGHGYGKLEYWHLPLVQNEARTGQGNAYLSPGAGTWSSVYRRIPGARVANGGCWGKVHVNPKGAKFVAIDVTDHTTGKSLSGFPTKVPETQLAGSGYRALGFSFRAAWATVNVEVKVIHVAPGSVQALRVDDLSVDCYVL